MSRDEWARVEYTTHESRCPGETAPGIPGNGSVRREALRSDKDGNFKLEVLRLRSKFRQGGWEIWGLFKGQMPQALYFRHREAKTNMNGWQEGKKIDVTLG